jgi:predicted PurR-regulated permease PerM
MYADTPGQYHECMQHTQHARRFFYILLAVVAGLSALFLAPYLTVILFAVVLGFLFHPLYAWLERFTGGRYWLAVPLALIGVFLSFVVPFAIAGVLTAHVISSFVHSASNSNLAAQLSLTTTIPHFNDFLAKVPGIHYQVSLDMVNGWIQQALDSIRGSIWQGVKGIGGTVALLIPTFFITLYTMGAVFTRFSRINLYLHQLSPLDDEIDSLYARRITSMIVSMVRGTLVIATIQGVMTGIFLWIAGVPYAAFFGLVGIVLSIIPLGSGVIALPAGLILIATGHIWQGILQIGGYFLVTSNIDNFLRPRLVSKDASLHPALVLIGAFTGLYHFGFLGVIFGPVIMVLLVTTIEVYREYFAPRE